MNAPRNFGIRFWSLALALLVPVVEIFAEGGHIDYEVERAVVAFLGISLLVHSWFMQRRDVKSIWSLAFWTLLLTLFALGFLWLGLNSIRGSTYPNDPHASNLAYWFAVEWQDRIIFLARVLAAALGVWIVVDLTRRTVLYLNGNRKRATHGIRS
jgi:hypothetical protein